MLDFARCLGNLDPMGSNCQLSCGNRRSERQRPACDEVRSPTGSSILSATPTRSLPHPRRRFRDAGTLALLLALGCGDNGGDGSESGGSSSGPVGSSGESSGSGSGSAATEVTSGGTDQPNTTGVETGDDPGDIGPNFGVLTFTLYPADASGSPLQLGMAGAWRTEPATTDDFFAVRSLGLFFPLAPAEPDTLAVLDPATYEWGKAETWVALGNGVRLSGTGGDALACLQLVEASFPVYLSESAENLDPACAPDPAFWLPGATYDLVSYGGEAFADQSRAAAVTTPTALTLTAPAIDEFDFPLEKAKGVQLAWTADGGEGDRVVIRVWDQFGKQIVVHAADDGSQDIPGAELDKLAAGPATLTIAREHVSELGLEPGTLRVVARHETWAYPDLF
jgi:hypothetical protein